MLENKQSISYLEIKLKQILENPGTWINSNFRLFTLDH